MFIVVSFVSWCQIFIIRIISTTYLIKFPHNFAWKKQRYQNILTISICYTYNRHPPLYWKKKNQNISSNRISFTILYYNIAFILFYLYFLFLFLFFAGRSTKIKVTLTFSYRIEILKPRKIGCFLIRFSWRKFNKYS